MYISRLKLNKEDKTKIAIFENPGIFHGAIENAFDGSGGRKLWRVDFFNDDYYLIMTSETLGNMSCISEQFGATGCDWESKQYEVLFNKIKNGNFYKFKLVANPCRCVNGKRKAHTTIDFQKKWLIDRSEKNGFTILPEWFDVKSRSDLRFAHSKKERNVQMVSATYEGVLKVTDKDKFCEMLKNGIGKSKAYGHGMMTVMSA